MRILLRTSRSGSTDRGWAGTWRRAACCIGLVLAVGASPALAERVALVIGNAEYAEETAKLTNPVRDARAMAEMLDDLGFSVTRKENTNIEEMDEAVDAFIRQVRSGDTAVFYYSGHGIELDGENYLLPVDFSSSYTPARAKRRSTSAAEVQALMEEAGAEVRIVILDACRDNPFEGTKTFGRGGLAAMAPRGGLVAFAAESGARASDNPGQANGLYTQHLLEALERPGVPANVLFSRVQGAVRDASGGRQIPAYYDASAGNFVFRRGVELELPRLVLDRPVSGTLLDDGTGGQWVFDGTAGQDVSVNVDSVAFDTVVDLVSPTDTVIATDDDGGGTDSLLETTLPVSGRYRVRVAAYDDVGAGVYTVAVRSADPYVAGEVFRDCDNCPEMVVIPAGTFQMGSPASETGRWDEGPRHGVTLRSFAMGTKEVTFDEWDACVRGGGCNGYRPDDEGWGRGARPVINVSWEDAQAYVSWLSETTSARYRLPSESEWEYAARAGTTTPFHTGATISTDQANYNQNRGRTTPVGGFAPNAFGLYDVHGNVTEWVEDCRHGDYRGAPSDGTAWTRGGDCGLRGLRGGSWGQNPVRSANRDWLTTGNRFILTGFRVSRALNRPFSSVAAAADALLAEVVDALPVSAPAADVVTPVEAKLDGALLEMVRGQRDGQDAGALSDGGRVAVEIVCESPDHAAAVREQVVAAGGAVTASFEDHLWAEVPLAAVEGLAATPAVWTMALNRAVARPVARPAR